MKCKKQCTRSVRDQAIYIGIVKGNDDPQKMGRLTVWIPELGGDPDNPGSHYIVSYASPFAGATNPNSNRRDATDMGGSQTSYGFWMTPPDLENQVLVCFVNGDVGKGYWFACLWQANMNHMVPGIASSPTTDPNVASAPTVEYNKRAEVNTATPNRPIFNPLHMALETQGLNEDFERGWTTASARRESPSMSYGYITPRGNQLYVDDNPENEFIRMRTRNGAQILVHNTSGYVYINSKDGASWVEISDAGVDIYSQNSVSIRAENDLNFRADQDILMDAGGKFQVSAGGPITFKSGANIESLAAGSHVVSAGGDVSQKAGGNILSSAGGNLACDAGGNITQIAGGTHARQAGTILDNSGGASSANAPEATAAEGVNRMPAHEPWPDHPGATGQGAQIGSGDGVNHDYDRANAAGDNTADIPTTGSGKLGGGGDKLAGVHPDLVRVVRRAATISQVDFRVLEGLRSRSRQTQLVRSGASKTMNSRHLTGHAVDLGALVNGSVSWNWPLYHKIARAMKEAARLERVPIEWGGDWRSFKDGPHFQLPWSRYPA